VTEATVIYPKYEEYKDTIVIDFGKNGISSYYMDNWDLNELYEYLQEKFQRHPISNAEQVLNKVQEIFIQYHTQK
jgi:hypothetical protein